MKRLLLFFILLFPLLSQAQEPTDIKVIRLTRDSLYRRQNIYHHWKYISGDNIAWAAPGFNDSAWILKATTFINIENGEDKKLGFTGRAWFRKEFFSDSSLIDVPIAIEVEQDGASEIYLDGVPLIRYGEFRKNGVSQYLNLKYQPTIFVLKPGKHLLAIRYENYDAWKRFDRYDEGQTGFEIAFVNPEYSIATNRNAVWLVSMITLICGSIFLALFLVHFILFLFYRSVLSNLIFCLFNLGFAFFFYMMYSGVMTEGVRAQDFSTLAINIALSLTCFAMTALVNNLFGKRKLRFQLITVLCAAVIVMTFIHYETSAFMLAALGSICAIEATVLVCVAMYRKVKGARILGTGILFFVLFFASIIITSLALGGIELEGGWLTLVLAILAVMAVFSIPFSMSAYLAWNFASLNRSLKMQLQQVEILSKKTLQQEQEKQQMLESRKEELEKEVALRTNEVLEQKSKIEQQHSALKEEKKKSDDLLLNILPAEVAEELKQTGTTKAQHFDHVSVLFTDFVNFTQISEQLSPDELVQALHECFRAFDEIMERNGLEKIKTIGDAYLAVSGMPVANEQHAYRAVKAGLEIVAFVKSRSFKEHAFEVRVGINSGPLVAGIVGVKKFAYDIWGDTVNMASRMESNSESGKINISENTHALVLHNFTFTYRGKINAKNKGDVDMYFVDTEIVKS